MNMLGKKALRLTTAALLAGMALGAGQASGATVRHATKLAPSGVVAITDWQFPDGCGFGAASVANTEICGPMSDGLVTVDSHLNYIPDLLTKIPTLSNGGVKIVGGNLVATYTLKPNLKWSDGSPLTPADFVFGDAVNIALGNSQGIDQIKSIAAPNNTTMVVTYNGTYAPYYTSGAPIPEPKAYFIKKYGSSDIKTIASKAINDLYNSPSDVFNGPYKIQSWTNGQSIVIVPNPYYNALPPAPGHPIPAQIKFVNISGDEAGLAAALQSSSAGVDKAEDFQATDLPVLNSGKFHITVQPALFVEHLELNTGGPLHDVRLRQALQYAIDKHALFHALFPNFSEAQINNLLLKSVLPTISPWVDPKLKVSQYNVAKAKALVEAAGYSSSYSGSGKHLNLRFATTQAGVRQKDFQILARDWAAIGVHVTPNFASGNPSANGGMFSPYNLNGVLAQRRFDVALFAFSEPPEPQSEETSFDPSLVPTAALHGAGDQNYCGITDQDQWKLLQQARTALDSSQRHAIFNKWQELVNSRVYFIMLYARTNITADDGKIGNYSPNPSSVGNEWNAFQYYVKS